MATFGKIITRTELEETRPAPVLREVVHRELSEIDIEVNAATEAYDKAYIAWCQATNHGVSKTIEANLWNAAQEAYTAAREACARRWAQDG